MVVTIVLCSYDGGGVGELQRSSAQGYIIVRDIVTVGVCDGGSGRRCGCFEPLQGVCLRMAGAHAADLIGRCTGASASSAVVSGAARIRLQIRRGAICTNSAMHASNAGLIDSRRG